MLRNRTKENVQVRTTRQRIMGALGYVIIFTFLYLPLFVKGGFAGRIIPNTAWLQLTGALLCIVGVGTCIWSRALLGSNWSGGVTAKKDHELVVKGPYRLVRHPIYTGFICALAGTCLVTGGLGAIVITSVYTLGLCMKINQEEVLLSDIFPGSYAAYQQHTRKLIPFIW
ncbi:MAG TPA: isoprenylcysteine carboxylmethyltransferase family protein [Chitinophaga sp.]|uniref:methyltransferase family protein n=1 Tax=Chitinophaga sp. TaxID=1869181 RepID=UPI002B8D4349|nr:isoprenylcysteine carboxylmethyltransferase family protein [Chitinophaga sp.]HVI46348.1 isoprenylcysteine carboxylmethyltransferase family protein [Chitinophaga sp.]